MKKIILALTSLMLFANLAFADVKVAPQALPKDAQNFITKFFKGTTIIQVEQDYDSFDVALNNGTKVEFYANGEWKEVKAYSPLPSGILPAAVEKTAKSKQKANIIKVEKNWNHYEIKFDNNMEVFVDFKGNFLGEKID